MATEWERERRTRGKKEEDGKKKEEEERVRSGRAEEKSMCRRKEGRGGKSDRE